VFVRPNAGMDVQELRRRALRAYIDQEFGTSVNAFALKLDRAPSFFNELLRKKRPFREQLAEKLEHEIVAKGLPQLALRNPPEGQESHGAAVVHLPQRWPFSFARERFERLTDTQKARIDERLCAMLEQFEAEPKPKRATKRR
jgi:hypothetical protein